MRRVLVPLPDGQEGDVELEVTGGNQPHGCKSVINRAIAAANFLRYIGLIFLLILVLSANQIVISYLLGNLAEEQALLKAAGELQP